jgi:hypothetical protein
LPKPAARRAVLVAALLAAAADAAAQSYPHLDWEAELDLRFRRVYRADDGVRVWNWFTESEASAALHMTPALALHGTIHAEPGSEEVTEDNLFENTAFFLEQLYLAWDGESAGLRAGKFNPRFGLAPRRTPGAFDKDFTEEYELEEAIGAGASLAHADARWGRHELSAALFFFDNTPASLTLGERRFETPEGVRKRRNRLEYGGLGNSRTPQSWTIALRGGEAAALPGLAYGLGYSRLAAGEGDAKAQHGYVAGVEYEIVLDTAISLVPFAEVAYFCHDGGRAEIDSRFLTLAASLQWRRWSISPVYVERRFSDGLFEEADDGAGGTLMERIDPRDRYLAVSVGYAFHARPELMLGWKDQREGGTDSQTVGLRLVYRLGEGDAH